MKILFWLNIGMDRYGPSVHLLKEMIGRSLDAGHEAAMIVRNTGGEEPDVPAELQQYKNLTCEVVSDHLQEKGQLVKRYFEDIWYNYRCRKILKKHKDADAVFIQSCTAPIFPIRIAKRILKKPVLFNDQNIFPNDALVLGKLSQSGIKGMAYRTFQRMQHKAYQEADRIVTISEDMKKTLVAEGASEEKIHVIYNWSYDDEAVDIPDEENLFLRDHPEQRDKFRVVFAGNLGAMVNARIIADAAQLLKSYEDMQFVIIGGGNNMQYLKDLAQEKNLTNMSFYPYQPENYARHNYAMADVNINALPRGIIGTCMPSKTATMLNSARPMVVSVETDSVYAGILRQAEKSTVVDVDDVQGFANAVLDIYRNGRRQTSINARQVFRKYCSCENAKKYVEILEEMAK